MSALLDVVAWGVALFGAAVLVDDILIMRREYLDRVMREIESKAAGKDQ